ncbi:MAG: mechanosensitive ion channel family protein [Candidatus Cyclobacteriaceae bacterium M2_1C_046]
MKKIPQWLEENIGLSRPVQEDIVLSLMIIFVLWLLHYLILTIVFKKVKDVKERYFWRSGTTYLVFTVGFIALLLVWVEAYGSLGTFLGLLSAGLAIALKDPITNFFAWIFIIIRRPFRVGERIQIGEHAGDVIDIRIFQFTLNEIGNWVDADQSTGRIIHVPNSLVFTKAQANYNRGFSHIWNEIPVLITFESDWRVAKAELQKIAEEHAEQLSRGAQKQLIEASRKFMIFYRKLTPIVYTSVKDSGILLTIRYLCIPQRRRGSQQAIWEDILETFEKNPNIEFAYPTQRVYFEHHDQEELKKTFTNKNRKPNS